MRNSDPFLISSLKKFFFILFLFGGYSSLQAQSITVTSPCTGGQVTLGLQGTLNGKNFYSDGNYHVSWDGSQWIVEDINGRTYYYNTMATSPNPPCFGVGTWTTFQCPFGPLTELTGNCDPGAPPCADNDGDGFNDANCGGNDCNDNDPNVNPGSSPILTNVIPHNPNSVTVYWNNIPNSTSYGIRYRVQGSSDPWTEGTSLRAYRRLFSLLACTNYEVQFRNYINGAWNCWSQNYSFSSPCAKSATKGG